MDKTALAVSVFDRNAHSYEGKYMDVSLYADILDLFCKGINKQDATILELACGPGNITQYLLQKRPDFQVLGTDLAPNMIELARKNNPSAVFSIMDCRDINKLTAKYDGIVAGFCLPYLSKDDAIQLIYSAAERLSSGGMLYLSTMEDSYSRSRLHTSAAGDQLYIFYHEDGYLRKAIENKGMKIIDVQHKHYLSQNGADTDDLIILARKP